MPREQLEDCRSRWMKGSKRLWQTCHLQQVRNGVDRLVLCLLDLERLDQAMVLPWV